VYKRQIERFGSFLPYVEPNEGADHPGDVVAKWQGAARQAEINLNGLRVAELGPGRAHGTGNHLLEAGVSSWVGIEPFRSADPPPAPLKKVSWAGELPPASVDVVVSHSVLEHVRTPDQLLKDLDQLLTPDGVMIHVVDYRDHFFKYPFHFLTFTEKAWQRWLDPGDLPRWRLYDHVGWFSQAGWTVEVVNEVRDEAAFERVRSELKPPFSSAPETVCVTGATLIVRRKTA